MATVFQMNYIPCKTLLTTTPQYLQITSKPSILPLKSIKRIQNSSSTTHILTRNTIQSRPGFRVFAAEDKEWVWEQEEPATESVAEEEGKVEVERLKKGLVDSFYGTARGLKATGETRTEICELITQLQARNPTPSPTQALPLLHGKWILAYTSFKGLFPLLSSVQFQLVKVEEISQTIDAQSLTVQNSVQFSGPLASNSNTTNAKFEVRGVKIKFEEGVIRTPQLTDSIVLPENVEFLGQKFHLAPIKPLLTSVQDTASSVAKSISSRFPRHSNADSWLLTTYVDEDLRISRGVSGSIFVLIKEGSSFLAP
ncbi:plastoglobulin 35, fibrillin 1a, fibrillin [Hibiscus trionum]|uniref:Plastoglobulin 35, fibrillin 1a, fibrillin n=1 Tax=Hibiscus trionum TaxID=183268 RepID=A0A9W7J518_HIBTR|nr:plastoglobulin 35, fibrillin 1a, fibrillin [Hibiscus trionum]